VTAVQQWISQEKQVLMDTKTPALGDKREGEGAWRSESRRPSKAFLRERRFDQLRRGRGDERQHKTDNVREGRKSMIKADGGPWGVSV
jgi:hypothetical protein